MKRLLAALLPSESREHVLGDLAERGFRARDIATALPAAWFAHLLRELVGPVPSLAQASNDTLLARAATLRRSARAGIAIFIWTMLTSPARNWLHLGGLMVLLPGFVAAVAVYLISLSADSARPYRVPLQEYREALRRQGFSAILPTMLWILVVHAFRSELRASTWGKALVISGLVVTVGFTFHRMKRLRAEKSNLRSGGS